VSPDFLTLEEVLDLHALQLARYGGGEGLRDLGLLESALAQPMATFGGEYVHSSLWEMAAAYLFHIVSNHPFIDGNKRAGLLAALVFLEINGVSLTRGSEDLYELTLSVASGSTSKAEVASTLQRLAEQ
jgi:death-on-curing protein